MYRGVLVPIKEPIWRGKVGQRDFGACNVAVPVASVPTTSIYGSTFLPRVGALQDVVEGGSLLLLT